jgi:hypothetical protein
MTEADFATQLNTLRETAARSIDACLTAKYIALSDERVHVLFLKKIQDGNSFRGIFCLNRIGVPENRYVYFDFDCKPGTVCLVKPAFLAVVNVADGFVVAVVDPYIVAELASAGQNIKGPGGIPIIETAGSIAGGAGGPTPPLGWNGGTLPLAGFGTVPFSLGNGGTLPLGGMPGNAGTLPLLGNGGTLPLRVAGYVVVPSGWGMGSG